MTSHDLDNMIAVLQAHKEGKTIQMKSRDGRLLPGWTDSTTYDYNWAGYDYRVKPETPKEFWINVYTSNDYHGLHRTEEHAKKSLTPGGKTIHVREVME